MFGLITMFAGLLGVPLGSILSQRLRKRFPTADPVICAIGLLLSAPLLTGACLLVSSQTSFTYTLIFFGQLALNLNWAIVADILLVRTNQMKTTKNKLPQIPNQIYVFINIQKIQNKNCTKKDQLLLFRLL